MGWGSHCPDCGKTDCKWVHGPVCQGTLPDFIKKFAALKAENERLESERDKWEKRACTGDDVLARTRDKLSAAERALAAKDAELSVQVEAKEHARRECERAETAHAEAMKALEKAREVVDVCAGDNRPARSWAITVRDEIDAALAARRALTGGQGE